MKTAPPDCNQFAVRGGVYFLNLTILAEEEGRCSIESDSAEGIFGDLGQTKPRLTLSVSYLSAPEALGTMG